MGRNRTTQLSSAFRTAEVAFRTAEVHQPSGYECESADTEHQGSIGPQSAQAQHVIMS